MQLREVATGKTQSIIRIAVLEEQIHGVREQQKSHHEAAQRRFDSIEQKLEALTALLNRGRGAYAVAMAVAAGIGVVLMEGLSFLLTSIHR